MTEPDLKRSENQNTKEDIRERFTLWEMLLL